jgi:anti-sigma regulatory factor (Ser/Thr protein kinase)
MDHDGRRCVWTISDEGPGFDVEGVLGRQLGDPERLLLASGRGLQIMRTFMDEVRFEDGGRRVILVLLRDGAKAIGGAPPSTPTVQPDHSFLHLEPRTLAA